MFYSVFYVSVLIFVATGQNVPKCNTESCIQKYGNLREIVGKVQYLVSTNLKSNNAFKEEIQQVKSQLETYKKDNEDLTATVTSLNAQLEAQQTELNALKESLKLKAEGGSAILNDTHKLQQQLSSRLSCQLDLLATAGSITTQCGGNSDGHSKVAFMVYRKEGKIPDPADGQTFSQWYDLSFPEVKLNLGNGYKESTLAQYFKAPVKGIYMFSIRVTGFRWGCLISLVKNGNSVSKSSTATITGGQPTSTQVDIIELQKGDFISVKVRPVFNSADEIMVDADDFYHAFSGYLMQQLE